MKTFKTLWFPNLSYMPHFLNCVPWNGDISVLSTVPHHILGVDRPNGVAVLIEVYTVAWDRCFAEAKREVPEVKVIGE